MKVLLSKQTSRRIALMLLLSIFMSLFAFQTVAYAEDRVDITEKFEDKAFRNFVYSAIGKIPGEPIYDTDVANIYEFKVHNSNDQPPVRSLAGIEYFTGLVRLRVVNCQITELNMTMLKQLKYLNVHSCANLKTIDVRGMEQLEILSCHFNGLTELKLSCSSLTSLNCSENQLSELDLSDCPALEQMYCDSNNLQTLDVRSCPKLNMLLCRNNLFKDTSAIIGYDEREWLDPNYTLDFYPQKTQPSVGLVLQDVAQTDWFYDAVQYTFERGFMKGVSDDRFAPQDEVSRAMTATVLHRLAGEQEAKGSNPFPDVEAGQWYSDAVIWAAGEKIIEGYGNGSFGTNDSVTREQLVTMFWRAQGKPVANAQVLSAYSDAAEISPWAEDAFAWAVSTGLIQGKPGKILDPSGTTSRAQLATILMRTNEAN